MGLESDRPGWEQIGSESGVGCLLELNLVQDYKFLDNYLE